MGDNLLKNDGTQNGEIPFLNLPVLDQINVSTITQIISFIASGFMIFGGIVPYVPQYRIIQRSRNATGFSNLVCLALLIANILRILFWFGHQFETPLLIQSVIMIFTMLIMLELCTRVSGENGHLTSQRRFTDFDAQYFWKWTDFNSYLHFLTVFSLTGGILTYMMLHVGFFIETLGFLSVFTEAMLAAPQFYRNYINKSTKGMSIVMVLMWTSGDIFKTSYFILRSSPTQFWLCGMLQVSLDISVLAQVYMYKNSVIMKPIPK